MNHTSHRVPSDTAAAREQPSRPAAPRRAPGELFLESLQRRVYGAIGLTAEDCQQREWVGQQTILPLRLQQKAEQLAPAEFAQYRAAVLDALSRDELLPRPTVFERPHQYSILRSLKVAIEAAAEQLSIGLPFTPVLGTLPTRLLEPLMVPMHETDEVVLIVDGSLLTYVHLLAKAVTHAVPASLLDLEGPEPPVPPPGWESRIDPTGGATQRFVELMVGALNGAPATAPAYAPEPACEQTVASLCECMELFILAREYARLCEADHLVANVEQRHACGQSFQALVWTARQEYRADALGLALMLAAAGEKGESPHIAFWGADILLASLAGIDRAVRLAEGPMAATLVARPWTIFDERRARLRALMQEFDNGQSAARFVGALEPIVATLSERFDIVLQEMCFGPRPVH